MRLLFFLATTLSCASLAISFEYDDEVRPSYVSRRAIDGTRGRKYFNPQEDGFFDDFGYEKGQYHGTKEQFGFDDLRSNVPGEPGIDYPAYVKIPRTKFSCIQRERGYYADEEAGCQVFHVCDGGLVSSFLCPVGSLFSQRLLTCDWWSKVPCSQSHEFYAHQYHADDVPLINDDMLRHALTETMDYHDVPDVRLDQENESDKTVPILVSLRRNENQLDNEHKRRNQVRGNHRNRFHEQSGGIGSTTTGKPEDSPVIRIKTLGVERNSRVRGHSSFRTSGSDSQGRHNPHPTEVPTTEPSVTIPSKENNRSGATTTTPFETSSQQYQDSRVGVNVSLDAPTKKGLQEDVNDTNSKEQLGDHNSAYEYDDMEGKESIGLASSHAERNMEKEEEKAITSTESLENQSSSETTTVESLMENTTPFTAEKIETTTLTDENIQAKESIGLVHSKVQEKLQLYDNEKATTTDNIQQNGEESRTEEVTKSVDDNIDVTTQQNLAEISTSTLSPSENEFSAEATTFVAYTANEIPEITTQAPRIQSVRKMSGFRINIAEKRKTTEATKLSSYETTSLDLQQSTNLSDTVATTTILPVTVSNSEDQTTIESNYVRRISDTVEESNSPLEVTLTVNGSSSFTKNDDQSPLGADILGQLISEHVNSPIDLSDLEIVTSAQTAQTATPQQNQYEVPSSTPIVRTYQNIRNYQNEQNNRQNYRTYKPEPIQTTTFSPRYQTIQDLLTPTTQASYQNFKNYQNYQDESNNYPTYQSEPPRHSRNRFYYHSTTQAPQNYRNYDTYHDERRNYRHPKSNNFVSTTARNVIKNYDETLNTASYQNQPQTQSLKIYQNINRPSENYQNSRNEAENYRNYPVNYQTHHYPENFADYHQRQQLNYQSYNNQNYGDYRDVKNPPIYQSQEKTQVQQKDHSHRNPNYPDYQNYDSSEDLVENVQFGDVLFGAKFGARISSKNQNLKKVINEKSKVTDDADAHTINTGLQQGRAANFLWAMSQLAKTDRLPRPFTQNRHKYDENIMNTQGNSNYANSFADIHNTVRNLVNNYKNVHNVNPVPSNFNNYDDNYNRYNHNRSESVSNANIDNNRNFNANLQHNFTETQYNPNVDYFAAPKLEEPNTVYQNNNYNDYSNQGDERFNNVPPTFGLVNQQNFSDLRQERILNYASPSPIPESPLQYSEILQPHLDTHSVQNTPQVDPLPFNASPQYFNDYNLENTQTTNDQYQSNPQVQPINYQPISYQQSTQPTVENTPLHISQNFQATGDPLSQPVNYENYNEQPITPQTIGSAHISSTNFPLLRNTQPQQIEYTSQSTAQPPSVNIENVSIQSDNQNHNQFNITKTSTTTKTTVETEFIPSLSFDFGSDQGRKEYLEALEKGLVPNDDRARKISEDISSSASAKVEKKVEEVEEQVSKSGKSEKSDNMDNFKDTAEVMSEIE